MSTGNTIETLNNSPAPVPIQSGGDGGKIPVMAIFDIGKTNKKFFLFDENLKEVYQEYISFKEITDDDDFPCDDLQLIEQWVLKTYDAIALNEKYEITAINFSAYGATMVHLDKELKPVTHLYNYTKIIPDNILQKFKLSYDPEGKWPEETASPLLGMLNAGLQLYWLKNDKPALFAKIKYSVFLPQYLSYLFSKVLLTEYTGIGCHTGMWNFEFNHFHQWMYAEGFAELIPPIHLKEVVKLPGSNIVIGMGIHDSSAALLPYISGNTAPFILLSTGTWSICLNPFNDTILSQYELKQDCLCYLQPNGQKVKASRLFLGNEYNSWIKKLSLFFGVDDAYHKKLFFDKALYEKAERVLSPLFHWSSIEHPNNKITRLSNINLSWFDNYEEAYHHLLKELVELQVEKIRLVVNNISVKRMFVDGGFVDNSIFINILSQKLPDFEIIPSSMPLGSAIGAALAIHKGNTESIPGDLNLIVLNMYTAPKEVNENIF